MFINLDIFYLNPNDTLNGLLTQYDSYTGLTLEGYFSCFLVLLSVQFFSILIIKLLLVKKMRMEGSRLDILRHCFENMNVPVPWEDFDVQKGKIEEYKKRRVSVHWEMFWVMVVNLVFHLLMAVPLIYTGSNIIQRHNLLSRTIGTREEENESYFHLLILLPVLIVSVITFSILEMVFYFLYSFKVKSGVNNLSSNFHINFSAPSNQVDVYQA